MVKYSDQDDGFYLRVKTALRPILCKVPGMCDAVSAEAGNSRV
jgi:hypothetical protein